MNTECKIDASLKDSSNVKFRLDNKVYGLKTITNSAKPAKGGGEWKTVRRKKVHFSRKRNKLNPITSYGIILFTIDPEGNILYLIAQRRDTIEYVDFIRGQYNYKDVETLFTLMSEEERYRIATYSFVELWKDLWINRTHRIYKECFDKARSKFDRISLEIPDILAKTSTKVQEPSWIFPKGKKNIRETSIQCAFREFIEETRMATEDVYLFNDKPFTETFKGSNEKLYRTNYYVAYTVNKIAINRFETNEVVRSDRYTVSEEIANMEWNTLDQAKAKLNERRRKLLEEVDEFIKQKLMSSIM